MNNLDKDYCNLLQDILDNGTKKQTRNGEVISVFGRQIRHSMKNGFPLLTSKKMYFKGICVELLWFLQGRTDLKYLLDNDCHIWDGDAYKRYWDAHPDAEKSFQYEGSTIETRRMTKDEFIDMIKKDNEFAKKYGELGPIYGKQWRRWNGNGSPLTKDYEGNISSYLVKPIDQIANLINDLKTNPDSRRMIVTAWNPSEVDDCVLPPCHYGFQVYTRELSGEERWELYSNRFIQMKPYKFQKMLDGNWVESSIEDDMLEYDTFNIPKRAISLMFNMRSNDVPLGLPFNLASYGLLLEILGTIVNMVPDELIANLGDAHVYLNQIDGVKEQLTREPFELPSLRINTEFWPTQTGECGEGLLSNDIGFIINNMQITDFQIENYKSHPAIKIPLSN